jgi:hypothetical protein
MGDVVNMWAKTKSAPGYLFAKRKGEGVVVKMPPC